MTAPETRCEEPDADKPEGICGAAEARNKRCLAHLDTDERTAYLATLAPGSDIDVTGVVFTDDLLPQLLNALRDDGGVARIGAAKCTNTAFFEDAQFETMTFSGDVHFDGATFSGMADFAGSAISGHSHFNETKFSELANFSGTTFLGETDFNHAIFSREAWFDGARCSRKANFAEATFCGRANFRYRKFFGGADFSHTSFFREVTFSCATFSENAGFSDTMFSGPANFNEATFSGSYTWFDDPIFSGDVSFKQAAFSGIASFRATFAGNASISGRAEHLYLDHAVVSSELEVVLAGKTVSARGMRSQGRVSFRLRAAQVDLSDAVCMGPLTVHGLQQPMREMDESKLHDEAGRVPSVAIASLREVDADLLTLTNVDLSGCMFAGLHRLDQVRLDGRCTFATDPRRRRRVLAEEHHWRAGQRADHGRRPGGWIPAPKVTEVMEPPRLEVMYRQLRKALEDTKDEPGAGDFYYGEMEMRRAGARQGERVLLWLYWLISGYGLRAGRAIAALAVVVVLLALGMKYAGFPGKPVPYLDALLYSLRSTFAVDVMSPTVPETVTRWGQVFRILLRITGPLFVGLAALAIRNRVKR